MQAVEVRLQFRFLLDHNMLQSLENSAVAATSCQGPVNSRRGDICRPRQLFKRQPDRTRPLHHLLYAHNVLHNCNSVK